MLLHDQRAMAPSESSTHASATHLMFTGSQQRVFLRVLAQSDGQQSGAAVTPTDQGHAFADLRVCDVAAAIIAQNRWYFGLSSRKPIGVDLTQPIMQRDSVIRSLIAQLMPTVTSSLTAAGLPTDLPLPLPVVEQP